MNTHRLIRKSHRWLSVLFIAAVMAASYAAAIGQHTQSVLYYLPLPSLFLLMASGLYLFVLPYAARWRGTRTRAE